jgi:hypothetical protein
LTWRNALAPEHREVGGRALVRRREIEPDLEELERIRTIRFQQREHLAVHDAAAGR